RQTTRAARKVRRLWWYEAASWYDRGCRPLRARELLRQSLAAPRHTHARVRRAAQCHAQCSTAVRRARPGAAEHLDDDLADVDRSDEPRVRVRIDVSTGRR